MRQQEDNVLLRNSMRMILFLCSIATSFSFTIVSMEAPKRSLLQQLFHKFDKEIDPVQYITDDQSLIVSEQILVLNPNFPEHKNLTLDEPTFLKIHMVFEREQKLLRIVENEILNQSHVRIEQVKKDVRAGYFSKILSSVIAGYQADRLKKSEAIVETLRKQTDKETSAKPSANDESKNKPNLPLGLMSPSSLETLIMQPEASYSELFLGYLRKTITDPIGYLTSSKARTVADETIRFNPESIYYTAFNPTFPLHKKIVHNAFERQSRLLIAVENALQLDDYQTILKIDSSVKKDYFSDHLKAIIAGYLKATTLKQENNTESKKQEKFLESKKLWQEARETILKLPATQTSAENKSKSLTITSRLLDLKISAQQLKSEISISKISSTPPMAIPKNPLSYSSDVPLSLSAPKIVAKTSQSKLLCAEDDTAQEAQLAPAPESPSPFAFHGSDIPDWLTEGMEGVTPHDIQQGM